MEKRLVRISFTKTGDIRYISHLDLGRTFMRALRRAEIPLWFSEGFSPHPKLNFALPLSVGTESLCELCDIAVPADAPEGCMAPLAEELPKGVEITRIEENPTRKFQAIEYALYRLEFPGAADSAPLFEKRLREPMPVAKRSKKGETTVDVGAMIAEVTTEVQNDCLILHLLLPAGGERGYLNPEYILKALEQEADFAPFCENCRIVREALFDGTKSAF